MSDLDDAGAALERAAAALAAADAALRAHAPDGSALRDALARADAAEAELRAARAEAAEMRAALDEALGVAMARKAELATLRRGGLPGAISAPVASPPAALPRVRFVQVAPVVPATPPPAVRPVSFPDPSVVQATEPVPAEGAVVQNVFLAWCRDARPIVSQVRFFAEAVRRALPDATVDAVYRDANSQASPVTLRPSGGASPVEYWRVGVGGQHWLVPQPLGPAQFRELAPCLSGTATPATLARLLPARLVASGDVFTLDRPGHVSAAA